MGPIGSVALQFRCLFLAPGVLRPDVTYERYRFYSASGVVTPDGFVYFEGKRDAVGVPRAANEHGMLMSSTTLVGMPRLAFHNTYIAARAVAFSINVSRSPARTPRGAACLLSRVREITSRLPGRSRYVGRRAAESANERDRRAGTPDRPRPLG